jgi:hypothetical protein
MSQKDTQPTAVFNRSLSRPLTRTAVVRRLVLALVGMGGVAIGVSLWAKAQSALTAPVDTAGNAAVGDATQDSAVAALHQQWGVRSILDPVGYAVALNQLKTPEQLAAEQQAMSMILQPDAYNAQAQATKSPEQAQAEQQAAAAILDPVSAAAEHDSTATPEQKAEEAAAAFSILNPKLQ